MKNKSGLKTLFIIAIMLLGVSLFGADTDATVILKSTANKQISGEIGWLFIVGGIILAALSMIIQKNIVVPIIILIGAIVFAMSPELADGIISQFGKTS